MSKIKDASFCWKIKEDAFEEIVNRLIEIAKRSDKNPDGDSAKLETFFCCLVNSEIKSLTNSEIIRILKEKINKEKINKEKINK